MFGAEMGFLIGCLGFGIIYQVVPIFALNMYLDLYT